VLGLDVGPSLVGEALRPKVESDPAVEPPSEPSRRPAHARDGPGEGRPRPAAGDRLGPAIGGILEPPAPVTVGLGPEGVHPHLVE
jgi:hypothetical protein